jgi:DtxR family transcriptional regulator, Mn-dependent transcriptional regulator
MKLSISEENHIKCIYHLQHNIGLVNTNAVAAELQTKPASVTDMLKKLKTKKILQYEKYKGFKLTEMGKKIALTIIRKHRLWEYFLTVKLGFDWAKVHAIAEELEHISSEELIQKLDDFLGNPSFDPHGDPIPDSMGKIPPIKQYSILQLPAKKKAIVSSVGNQSPEMLAMLKHYKIGIGSNIQITNIFQFDNSIEIKVNKNATTIVSEQVAKNIFVYYE